MKSKMKSAIVALASMLAVCLLFPSVASAQKGMPCTPDPVDMFIMYGNLVLCSIDQPGIVDIYRFNGTSGQRIEIIASSGTINPCIELVGVQTSCNGLDSRFWIDAVLPTTQEYTIRAYAAGSSQTGSYELDLESVVPPSPNARQTAYDTYLTDQINPAGDIEPVFYFTASVGDVIDVTTDSQTINPCIYLFAPDAHTTWNTCNGLQNQFEIRTNPVTVAGTYTILVYPAGPTTSGAYSVQLQCLSGPCVVAPIPDVSGYLTLQGTPLASAGVALLQPGAPGPQLTRTDHNGYYQFLHAIAGEDFTVQIEGPVVPQDFGKPDSTSAASADTVGKDPLK